MGIYKVDLLTRYQNAFGFLAKNVTSRVLKGVGISSTGIYANVDTFGDDNTEFDEITLSYKDLELKFGSLPFLGGNHGILEDIFELFSKENTFENIFAPPPMLSFTRQKNIKETPIDGSDGVVVENYGMQPWNIKMQGIVIDMEEHQYPKEQIKQLTQLFEIPDRIDVVGDTFADKGIDTIYFTSISIDGVEGFPDTQKYTLQARSIKPIEFELD